jgi:HEAT repeat protein
MTTFLDDIPNSTQHIFVTLAESLEDGEQLPTETLINYLRHPEDAIRRLTVELLEYNNDPIAIPALLEAAADANIEISIAAGDVLRSFRNVAGIPKLIEGLSSTRPETRLAAVVALRDRRAPSAVEDLLRSLGDPEPEVRREAVLALAQYRRDDLLLAFRSALRDESPAVRKVAVSVIAEFDSAFVFDDLILALDDPNWQVRREAAIALGRFPGQAAQAALLDSLNDSSWQVVRESVVSLGKLRPPGLGEVARLLLHELADLRIAVAVALGESRNPAWIERLEPLLNDPDTGVQKSARRAIERLASVKHQIV